MKEHRLFPVGLIAVLCGLLLGPASTPIYAQKIPALVDVPAEITAATREKLLRQKVGLENEVRAFQAAAAAFNAMSADAQTDAEFDSLQSRRLRYIASAKAFNQAVADASVVDLRHLDPDKPIVVDPNVVAGRQRVFPVQVNEETLKNADYNKGFECLRASDPFTAVACFEAALKERPGDPLMRNALLLAQDLVKVRQQKAREKALEKATHIAELTGDAYRALLTGDTTIAFAAAMQARELKGDDQRLQVLAAAAEKLKQASAPGASADQKNAAKLVAHGMVAFEVGRYRAAVAILEKAGRLSPNDPLIAQMLPVARKYESSDTSLLFPKDPIPGQSEPTDMSLLFPGPRDPPKEDWVKIFLFPGKSANQEQVEQLLYPDKKP